MLTIRAMSDGKGYSSRHLEHSDYYSEGERVTGQWRGHGAELLGLEGAVRHEDFEALRQGLDPRTGEFLRPRHSADRTGADGATQSQGRSLYDFTFSAPKSVSILAVLGTDDGLRDAHMTAVSEALEEAERYSAARVRQNGANGDRITGNMAIAVYQHDTSRELDPQLHTHAVAANLTYDGAESRWKALQAGGIYERRAYISEVYRNALAREVLRLGYQIESQRDSRGHDCGFEIAGLPDGLLRRFSQRSRQRDQAAREFENVHGRPPSDNEVAVLVRESRADKLVEISTEELRARQRARLTLTETELLDVYKSGRPTGRHELFPPGPSVQHAEDHVFERVSVARDHEILTEALQHGRGHIRHDELKGALLLRESAGELLRDGSEVATNASLEREREMIACVNRGIGACKPLGGSGVVISSDRLRPEQKRAVVFVLGSRDRVTGIRGAAGTGKTAALQELRRGIAEANVDILAVAPTVSAVEELQKAGFPDATTVERLLQDRRMNEGVSGKAIIVDEAGMLSSRQMSELLRLAEGSDARLVLCGDTRQIQSVEAGDALRVLESESRLKMASLTEVQRQTDQVYRKAIESLRRNPETGFDRLDQIGAVREVAGAERAQVVAAAYMEARALRNRSGQPSSTLVVCATHAEIDRVTSAIRAARQKTGDLSDGHQLAQDVPLGWTTAQKRDPRNFKAGHIIEFHRPVKGVGKNEVLEVVQREQDHVVARTAAGEKRKITRKQAEAFDVFEKRAIEIAAGDRLLLTANRRGGSFRATNGELVSVSRVDGGERIHLEDGRILPRDYRHFDYGYAVTAHRSQGKSVDAVVISADGMRKELFYVAASRGREGITVITSDKGALRDSVGRSTARKSATELAKRAAGRLQRGIHRGMAAARDMVWRARHWALPAVEAEIRREPRMERRYEVSLGR